MVELAQGDEGVDAEPIDDCLCVSFQVYLQTCEKGTYRRIGSMYCHLCPIRRDLYAAQYERCDKHN